MEAKFIKNEHGIMVKLCCVTCIYYQDSTCKARMPFKFDRRKECYCEKWRGNETFLNAGRTW